MSPEKDTLDGALLALVDGPVGRGGKPVGGGVGCGVDAAAGGSTGCSRGLRNWVWDMGALNGGKEGWAVPAGLLLATATAAGREAGAEAGLAPVKAALPWLNMGWGDAAEAGAAAAAAVGVARACRSMPGGPVGGRVGAPSASPGFKADGLGSSRPAEVVPLMPLLMGALRAGAAASIKEGGAEDAVCASGLCRAAVGGLRVGWTNVGASCFCRAAVGGPRVGRTEVGANAMGGVAVGDSMGGRPGWL